MNTGLIKGRRVLFYNRLKIRQKVWCLVVLVVAVATALAVLYFKTLGMAFQDEPAAQAVGILGMMLVTVLAALLISAPLVKDITEPIVKLSRHTEEFVMNGFVSSEASQADLDATTRTHRDELGHLGSALKLLQFSLSNYLVDLQETTAVKERMAGELAVARDIQMGMVPRVFPDVPEFTLYASMIPAKEVGGDLYNFFRLQDHTLGFAIGDVSGKGAAASLFMAVTTTLLKALANQIDDPATVVTRLNDELCRDNDACMFVTFWYGILDVRTGQVRFANGGHNPPVVIRADGTVSYLACESGVALGIMEGENYATETIQLDPGDKLLLYTDGVTEATNRADELYDEDRLEKDAADLATALPEAMVNEVNRRLEVFADGAPQSDDITMLALHFIQQHA